MNKLLLKSIMALHGDSVPDLAEYLGKSAQSVYNKMNESGTEFTQGEISKIATRYEMTAEQVMEVFFKKKVS